MIRLQLEKSSSVSLLVAAEIWSRIAWHTRQPWCGCRRFVRCLKIDDRAVVEGRLAAGNDAGADKGSRDFKLCLRHRKLATKATPSHLLNCERRLDSMLKQEFGWVSWRYDLNFVFCLSNIHRHLPWYYLQSLSTWPISRSYSSCLSLCISHILLWEVITYFLYVSLQLHDLMFFNTW